MGTVDVYGFVHEDLRAAREAIETALSLRLEEAQESDGSGCYFCWAITDPWDTRGVVLQIRSNSGSSLRWTGDPSNPWYPEYGVLVWVHGPARESVTEGLRSVPGLSFLETKATM